MNKPIEERVKNIIETNDLLNIKEKSEIICLIECYKGADLIIKQLMDERKQLNDKIDKAIKYIDSLCLEKDGYVGYGDDLSPIDLIEILKDSDVDE